MKVIFVWRCLPPCLLKVVKVFLPWSPEGLDHYPFRRAEKCFDPMEVSLSWNYVDHIITPTICFSMLCFLSPYVWKTFVGMLIWAIFELCFYRWLHLRFCRTCYYSTDRLDSCAQLLWGVPLSMVAMAAMLWGLRSEIILSQAPVYLRPLMVLATGFVSLLLWLVCYVCVTQPYKERDARELNRERTVEELKKTSVYSWLNTNPMFVLKCKYYFQDKDGKDIPDRRKDHPIACGEDQGQVRFYEVGKEYLFIKPERQELVHQHLSDSFEFETWFDLMLQFFGGLRNPCQDLEDHAEKERTKRRNAYEAGEAGLLLDTLTKVENAKILS